MARPQVQSLAERHPWRIDVPLLLFGSLVLLAFGLTMPAMEMRALFFWRDQFSIIRNIQNLYHDGKPEAAVLLAACSVAYPALKIAALFVLWLAPCPARWRRRVVRALRALGRWSMLDVFAVTAIVVGSGAIGPLEASPRPGIYVYAGAIFVLMLATVLMDRLARREP